MVRTYIFDAGHGGSDPGAIGNNLVEKVLTLEATLYLHNRCKELGIPSKVTRSTDISLDSTKRTNIVKQSGASVCISSHYNSATPSANGVETIHSIHTNKTFAQSILDHIVESSAKHLATRRAFSRKGKGNTDYYYMHRMTGSVETIIVEYGFLSNKKDADYLKTQANRHSLYEGVIKAICKREGVVYKNKSNETKPDKVITPKPVTPVSPSKPKTPTTHRVVAGSFSLRGNAEVRQKEVKTKAGIDTFLEAYKLSGVTYFRVIAGSFETKQNAINRRAVLKRVGIESFIQDS